MTLPMVFALAITVFMIVLIMIDRLPFGVPPLIACLLMVVFGVVPINVAFSAMPVDCRSKVVDVVQADDFGEEHA